MPPLLTESSNAVFLSYAAEDAAAAQRICAALRAGSIEVWFDQSELRGGDSWDATIRTQIKACALFIPVISMHSRARIEGYFRLEWKLAVDRSHLMAAEKPFLVPVVIDGINEADARVPDRFREVQWTRLPDGETPPDFVDRIRRLLAPVDDGLGPSTSRPAPVRLSPSSDPGASSSSPSPPRHPAYLPFVAAALLLGALAFLGWNKRSTPERAEAPPVAPPAVRVTDSSAVSDKSIAVLPFTDMSEKKDQEYFSDGLSEELIDLLAQIPELKVTARTSSFSFRGRPVTVADIGQALKVANILEGSVRKAGNTVRITAQLVRADNGYHLWSETYDRDLKDVFKVQDDIARVVVDKLKLTLTGTLPSTATRTDNTEAHNLLLQGLFALQSDTDESTAQALKAFQRALTIDPRYAPAWNELGWAKFRRGVNGYEPVLDAVKSAENSITRAIELDPKLAAAYGNLASIRLVQLDWRASAEAVDKALQLDPGDSGALFTRAIHTQATGSAAESVAAMQKALDRDPLNQLRRRYAARILYYSGGLTQAEALLRQILAASPAFSAAHYELGRVLLARGDVPTAVAEFEAESNPVWRVNGLPLGYHAAHRQADKEAALRNLLRNSDGAEFQVAEAYAYFGDNDHAFEWLNRAVKSDPGIIWLRNDPLCAGLTHDPRYPGILKRMNLPVPEN
jgi:TolB-like protein/cytochrome c-type biogenesis protein CcmH/NrfG